MTEDQLTIFRLQVRLYVHQQALHAALKLARVTPGADQALQQWAQMVQAEAEKTVLPDMRPGYSDMLTAELREAVQEMLDAM